MAEQKVIFKSFPKQDEFIEAALDPAMLFVLYGGAIRGGKTFAGLGALILFCLRWPGSRWAVVRKDLPTIKRNTLPAWSKIKPTNAINGRINLETMTVNFLNGSQIIFFPENYRQDKDLDRWKGLEVNGFLLEEINEIQQVSYEKAIERAGSYIIPDTPSHKQPPPKILATCNPTLGWVKDVVYTPWRKGTLPPNMTYIPSRIFDNPYIPQAYMNSLKSLPSYTYDVFVLGDWDVTLKTGGEFFKQFEPATHVGAYHVDPERPVHISIDSNVWPYISISYWQIQKEGEGWRIYQVGETCATDPRNTATAAGREVLRWLRRCKYKGGPIYVYGDPTTKARNTIDDNKRSFLDKFTRQIEKRHTVELRMFRKAPGVALTAEFINEIYLNNIFNLYIHIGEHCKESINDYIKTKEDKDGGMLKRRVTDPKTKISYEEHGHLSDTKRYFLVKLFEDEFKKFNNKASDPEAYHIAQVNQEIRGGI